VIVAALRFIRDHVGEGIAVKDVVRNLRRSRSDLDMRFRQAPGERPFGNPSIAFRPLSARRIRGTHRRRPPVLFIAITHV